METTFISIHGQTNTYDELNDPVDIGADVLW